MPDVSIITPTGDRPGSFALLERWVGGQTFTGSIEWIVVDDGRAPTICTAGQVYVRRARQPGEARHTLPHNLAEAVKRVSSPVVVIAEDDEWWGPEYLDTMVGRLGDAGLAGEGNSRLWCLRRRAWREAPTRNRASLCRTAWRSSLNEFVLGLCARGSPWIDLPLWAESPCSKRVWFSDDPREVSLKNVPGRRIRTRVHGWVSDSEAVVLRSWVGDEAAESYLALAPTPSAEVLPVAAPPQVLPTAAQALSLPRGDDGTINVVGYFRTSAGLSEHARRLGVLLERAGLPVFYLEAAHHHHYNAGAVRPVSTSDGPGDVTVWCLNASEMARNEWRPVGKRHVAVWMWELEFNPPPGLREAAACVDEVWAFSRFLERAFSGCGKPVHHVPPFVVPPVGGVPVPHKDSRFTALIVFDCASTWGRKNPLAAVRAFQSAFGSGDDVRLVIKIMRPNADRRFVAELIASCAGWPVQFLVDEMSMHEYWKLMASADCYLSMHRSEGIGLTMAEASWCGVPVLATGYGGNCDWLDDSCSIVVPHRLVPNDRSCGPYPVGAVWAEPDQAHAAGQLRRLYEDDEWRMELSARIRSRAVERLSGEPTSVVMLARLDSLVS